MKRWIALLMALMMAMVCSGACAQSVITGPRGPELPSSFEVDPNAGTDSANDQKLTMGTDVYLFVDPDSASYVTFYVHDDDSNAVRNAVIKITFNGTQAIYGVTDTGGMCSMYLFRDVFYVYTVEAEDHASTDGTIYATSDVTRINVELRTYHDLTVYVQQGGVPVPGASVSVAGRTQRTDGDGMAVFYDLVKGDYDLWVSTPDGRSVYRKVKLRGDLVLVIDLDSAFGALEDPDAFQGGFLVYDKEYAPEDYVLTQYKHEPLDVLRKPGEKDESYESRKLQYLAENPNTVVVEAQPDREQLPEGDRDLTRADGTLLYTQRSMMPAGSLLQTWEQQGYSRVIFANENAGLAFDLADLHSTDMTKLFALMRALSNGNVNRAAVEGAVLEADPQAIDVTQIDFRDLRPVEFGFDHAAEEADKPGRETHELLSDALYQDAVFEFRITPVEQDALVQTAQTGLENSFQEDPAVLNLSADEQVRQKFQKADGLLTDEEEPVLYTLFAERKQENTTAEELVQANAPRGMYRVSCWLHFAGLEADITALMPSLNLLWQAEADYQAQLAEAKQENPQASELENAQAAASALEESMRLLSMNEWNDLAAEEHALHTVRSMPLKEEELFSTLNRKLYRVYTVDVRWEKQQYTSEMEESVGRRKESYALNAEANASGLMWLTPAAE